ncbi:futalosine hydrolase [Alteribacter populi]|uniref:futalosine hydrolase n=1 Tax=Alteribacter populi TaxID=2011011 RepID=UPI000BBB6297|nr:futalosine hydrolase [Alteribacter populi]
MSENTDLHTKILIITSVEAEKEAVLNGLEDDPRFNVVVGGVGLASAAASTGAALAKNAYDLVINMGIGGGFAGRAEVGSLVISSEIVAADLGAETMEGFKPIDELGLGNSRILCDEERGGRLKIALEKMNLSVHSGLILTLSTVTGTAETARALSNRFPEVFSEAMEGYGVGIAAKQYDRPVMEVRSISNTVGPRDRGAWKIIEALAQLTKASRVLREVI